mmetsp:Transcript_41013/g.112849  ORF Transcript_41013/g.112849 Transcript_41013/m.112849 type:complete len:482 (+) Transcript_41013:266-1711(+)
MVVMPSRTLVLVFFMQLSRCACLERPRQQAPPASHRHIVPLHRQRVPVRSEDGIVSFKSVYFGTVFLGMPRQRFSMVFDTGSGHVIVPSVGCHSETCTMHSRYDPRLSSKSEEVDYDGTPIQAGAPRDQITVAFGTGEVTGQFANELLCLGTDQEEPPPKEAARSQAGKAFLGETNASIRDALDEVPPECIPVRIVMATEMTQEPFASFTFDGVLGLGLEGLALAPEFSYFGMLAKLGQLAHGSFGVFLADSDDDFSEISFGGHNPDRVSSALTYVPVAMPELGYWQVQILAVRVGGKPMDFCNDGQCRAVVDTGTSLIAVPGAFADPLQDALESSLQDPEPQAASALNCRDAVGPLLEFDIDENGATLTLGPGDYARSSIQTAEDDADEAVDAAAKALGGEDVAPPQEAKCRPTLMPIDLPEPLGPKLFILGEPVLRKYYTTYDWQLKRVGFGLAAHSHADEDDDETDDAPLLTRPLLML